MSDSPLSLVLNTDDWINSNLNESSIFIKDGTHGTHKRLSAGIPLLSAKNITSSGKIRCDENDSLISKEDYSKIHSKYELEKDDLLLTVVGTLGRRALVSGLAKFTIQRSVGVIRPDIEKITPGFIFHFCGTDFFQNQLDLRSNATAQAGVYLGELGKIPIPLPPLPEQQKIAAILTSVDEVIEKTQAQIDKLKDLKTGMMQSLLTIGVGIDGKPHNEFKDSPVGRIPKGWEVSTLGCEFKLLSGSTPSRQEKAYFSTEPSAIPWVKTTNLNDSYLFDVDERITQKALDETSCKLHPIGTALIAMYGGWNQIGRSGILTKESATNQAIVALISKKRIIGEFANYWLIANRYRWQSIAASSRKDPNITKQDVSDFLIVVPSEQEQKDIVARFDSLTDLINKNQEKNYLIQNTKKALMQDLLTGKVRVNVSSETVGH